MSYYLDSTEIRRPMNIDEETIDQFAQQVSLANTVARDYFGSTRRTWALDYVNTQPSEYQTIKTIVDAYKSTTTAKNFESTEANYTIAATPCHLDLVRRKFSVGGNQYISDFTLVITEV